MLVGSKIRRVAVLGGSRIPFARAHGAYAGLGNAEMMIAALRGVVERNRLQGLRLGEVAAGAVMKHSKDFNLVRECVLSTGLDPHTPGLDLQRACGTSLEAAIRRQQDRPRPDRRRHRRRRRYHQRHTGRLSARLPAAAAAVLSRPFLLGTRQPFLGIRPQHFKPIFPGAVEPRTGLSMGESCELMASTWKIPRADQDELAYASHLNAARAWKEGFHADLVQSFNGLASDNNIRAETTLERLAKLRPSFDPTSGQGTLTAGNSSPLTDGASAVLLASEDWARARNLPVQAWLTYGKAWAVDFASGRDGLLMAPAYAVPAMLNDAGLTLQDFDYYEIHEAFAAQVLCTLKAWESAEFCRERLGRETTLGAIDRAKLNVKGSSIAYGHPFAATGTRILATLAKLLATTPPRGAA